MSGDYVYDFQVEVVPNIKMKLSYLKTNGLEYTKIVKDGDLFERENDLFYVYALKPMYFDSSLGNNFPIYMDCVTQHTNYAYEYNNGSVYSYNKNVALRGFNLYFKSTEMKQKYDTIHSMNNENDAFLNESISKNIFLSGDGNTTNTLKAVYVDVVPKDYILGENAYITNYFKMWKNSFNFVNSLDDNNVGSYFSDELIFDCYGITKKDELDKFRKNNGCCMGMTIAQYFLRKNEYARKLLSNEFCKYSDYNCLLDHKKAVEFVKYCQNAPVLSKESWIITDHKKIVDELQHNSGNYVMNMTGKYLNEKGEYEYFGHSVVPICINNSENPNEYTIEIYNPNNNKKTQFAFISSNGKLKDYSEFFFYKDGQIEYYDMYIYNVKGLIENNNDVFEKIAEKVSGKNVIIPNRRNTNMTTMQKTFTR